MARHGETRQRIIQEAREAFNALGYRQVTVAALAERLAMSEGNLWYHFKTKAALLDALQNAFAAETRAHLEAFDRGSDPVTAYADFLLTWRTLFSRYLFVFRDRSQYGTNSPELVAAFPSLYSALEERVATLLRALIDHGALELAQEDVDVVAMNLILVTRFYFEFQNERLSPSAVNAQAQPDEAILHHFTLLKDRLRPDVEAAIRAKLAASAG